MKHTINRVMESTEETYNSSVVQHSSIAKDLEKDFTKTIDQNENTAAYLIALFNRVWSKYGNNV